MDYCHDVQTTFANPFFRDACFIFNSLHKKGTEESKLFRGIFEHNAWIREALHIYVTWQRYIPHIHVSP